jgi:hypothetical protein
MRSEVGVQSRQGGILTEEPASVSLNAGEREKQVGGCQGISGKVAHATGDVEEKGEAALFSDESESFGSGSKIHTGPQPFSPL